MSKDKYLGRGVSADKSEVHEAIKGIDKGLYPYAFCKILPDLLTKDDSYCTIMHADTAGTKTSLAYIYWRETGDLSVWKGIVQDALVMNLDDMACSGCTDDIMVSSTIGRNKNLISGDVIKAIIHGAQEFFDKMAGLGVNIVSAGGETADVGDIVRTIDVGFTAFGRLSRADVIDNNIKPGAFIVGFASYGQATYESEYNAGMGSNGLTSARHDVFAKVYMSKYPESFDHATDQSLVYAGSKLLTEEIEIDGHFYTIGKLVLSPTRTFLPVLKDIINGYRGQIQGIIHNTGGAHTKVSKFLKEPVKIIKDNLLPVSPLFKLIQEESNAEIEEMYKVFNMGTRLECYVDNLEVANGLIAIANKYNIDAQIIGRVEATLDSKSTIHVFHEGQELIY